MSELDTHVCVGPDAGQLLGFLCSLGLLEAGMRSLPDHVVRLGFAWHEVAFRPVLTVQPKVEPNRLVAQLHRWVAARAASLLLTRLGDDLPCDVDPFEVVAPRTPCFWRHGFLRSAWPPVVSLVLDRSALTTRSFAR